MSKFAIFSFVLVAAITQLSAVENKGFSYVGRSATSMYFLSNTNDKRNIFDSRTGCSDAFRSGQLVALETTVEHQEVRRWLSTWGVEQNDRVWTTGQHDGSEWVWYDYYSGTSTPIENGCKKPEWVIRGECPNGGCLAIGGRDLTYKWQNDTCEAKRRYLCEYPATGKLL